MVVNDELTMEESEGRHFVLVPLNGSKEAERVLQHVQDFSQCRAASIPCP